MTKVGKRIVEGAQQAAAFARGEDASGFIVHIPAPIDTRRIRAKLGMTQEQFCKTYGFELAALRDWEQGRRVPTGAAQTLIRVIDNDPAAVAAVVMSAPSAATARKRPARHVKSATRKKA